MRDLSVLEFAHVSERQRDAFSSWWWLILLAFFPLIPCTFTAPATMDYWFFLAKGERLWELGLSSLGGKNPFVFTTLEGSVFLDKEWLFGMGLRWYWEIFGHQGAGILRGGWIFLWCVLFFSIAHRLGADRWITALVFGLGAYSVLVVRMSVRPHTLGNLFVLVLFWLLTIPPKRWHLWAVLLLFVLWANIHGSFTVGGALLGAVGVWALWVPWWYRTRDPAFAAYAAQWRAWWWVLPVLPFVVCINPYGWRLWSVLWTFQREISSRPDPWVAPEWEAFSVTSPYANFLLGVLFLLAATWFLPERRRRSQWLLCMALGALLTFSNLRFVGLSFLILGPLLAAQLSLLKRPILRRLVVVGFAVSVMILGQQAWSNGPRWGLSPTMESEPVEALDILERHKGLRVRLFADLYTAGYISFRSHRHVQVAYDGNPLTPGFWAWSQAYKEALLSPQAWDGYCHKHRCEMVLLSLRNQINTALLAHLAEHSEWRPLYMSLRWAFYVRRAQEPSLFKGQGYEHIRSFYDLSVLLKAPRKALQTELYALRKQPSGGDLADVIEANIWLDQQRLGPYSAHLRCSSALRPIAQQHLRRLRLIAKKVPWHPGVAYLLGVLEMISGEISRSMEALEIAASWNPYWPKPWAAIYRIASVQKQPKIARYALMSLRRIGMIGEEAILRLRLAEKGIDAHSSASTPPPPSTTPSSRSSSAPR